MQNAGNQHDQDVTIFISRAQGACQLVEADFEYVCEMDDVKDFLGHKSITNTLRYIQLEAAIYRGAPDQYLSEVAKTVDEARQLTEAGFEYVTDIYGIKLFRKRE